MSDNKSFEIVTEEVANEVLQAAAVNAEAFKHLTELCGCATFHYGESVYLIITPENGDLMLDSHVIEITDAEMLQEIGEEVVRCGNPARKPLGRFLKEADMEDSNFFRALVASIETSMRLRGMEGPISPTFFDAEPAELSETDEDGANIPEEVMDAIIKWFGEDLGVMSFKVDRTATGIGITTERARLRENPFAGLGMMVLGGGNGIEGLLQALSGARARREAPEQPADDFDFEEFLKAQGINLGDGDGDGEDWLASLDDTEIDLDQFGGSIGSSFGDDFPLKGKFDPSMFADDESEEE